MESCCELWRPHKPSTISAISARETWFSPGLAKSLRAYPLAQVLAAASGGWSRVATGREGRKFKIRPGFQSSGEL